MEKKINKDKSIVHKCNILTNILNTKKRAKKSLINRQYHRAVWKPVAEGHYLGTFESYWIVEVV